MSATKIQEKISHVELALKDAGPNEALNAVIDTLKEIATTLETLEKAS